MKTNGEMWRVAICLSLAIILLFGVLGTAYAKDEIEVYAAASLTEAFTEFKQIFKKQNPNVDIINSFASTSTLRFQVEQGAVPDVFGSANEKHIVGLDKGGFIDGKYAAIAHNCVTIIVPKDNPANIDGVEDLARRRVDIVACAPEVPIGNYTVRVLDKIQKSGDCGADYKERVKRNFISLEPTVKGIVTKVRLGEADAGMVYASDVTPDVKKDVKVITIPEKYNVLATCYIGVIKDCDRPDLGRKYIELVLSDDGQKIMQKHGFVPIRKPKEESESAAK